MVLLWYNKYWCHKHEIMMTRGKVYMAGYHEIRCSGSLQEKKNSELPELRQWNIHQVLSLK